jgi:hypothetical protein
MEKNPKYPPDYFSTLQRSDEKKTREKGRMQ